MDETDFLVGQQRIDRFLSGGRGKGKANLSASQQRIDRFLIQETRQQRAEGITGLPYPWLGFQHSLVARPKYLRRFLERRITTCGRGARACVLRKEFNRLFPGANASPANVNQSLFKMMAAGQIVRVRAGRYRVTAAFDNERRFVGEPLMVGLRRRKGEAENFKRVAAGIALDDPFEGTRAIGDRISDDHRAMRKAKASAYRKARYETYGRAEYLRKKSDLRQKEEAQKAKIEEAARLEEILDGFEAPDDPFDGMRAIGEEVDGPIAP